MRTPATAAVQIKARLEALSSSNNYDSAELHHKQAHKEQ